MIYKRGDDPLFYCPVLKKEITKIIEDNFEADKYFLVDLHIGTAKNLVRIKLTIDSDKGIGIDECAEVSRKIYKLVEESGEAENFELEVTSPGVGEPLRLERQYIKNKGRLLKISFQDNKQVSGKLIEIKVGEGIVIEEVVKGKQKVAEKKITEVKFAEIKKAVVEVSFN